MGEGVGVSGHGPEISPDVDLAARLRAGLTGKASGGFLPLGQEISPERGQNLQSYCLARYPALRAGYRPRVYMLPVHPGYTPTLYTPGYTHSQVLAEEQRPSPPGAAAASARSAWAQAGDLAWVREECERVANIPVSPGMRAPARARARAQQRSDKDWIAQGSTRL